MKSRMKWGVTILIILLIGFSVFLLTRTPETEPEIIYNTPTPEEMEQVERNIQDAIDKAKKDQPPTAERDIPKVETETPHKNSQQNDSVETVTAENVLEGLENIDVFSSIILPTNEELASYTDEEIKQLYRVTHEADMKAAAISDEFEKRTLALEAATDGTQDIGKRLQLLEQRRQLREAHHDWREQGKQWRQEKARIRQNTQHYGRGN